MKNKVVRAVNYAVAVVAGLVALSGCAAKPGTAEAVGSYKTSTLEIQPVSANAFVHISSLQTQDFGQVACNGLVVRNGREAVVFDTPANDAAAAELLTWAREKLHCRITAVVPTHFHADCLGSLGIFAKAGVPSYASAKTIALARKAGVAVPERSFADSLVLFGGREKVVVRYFGEGHTADNVVAYFPSEKVLFGGCLVKEVGATKGFLGDANVAAWSATVRRVKQHYGAVQVVVPGHGKWGNTALLDYTIALFKTE